MDELYWDPFDVEIDSDPYAIWRRLRDEAPVYRNDRHDFWALSRFADVEAAHRDPETYGSSHGTVLELMSDQRLPEAMMIFLDPPDHTRLRALVSRAFTPRRVAHLEGRSRELCDQFLEPWAAGETFDFVQGFGARLPAMVIASLLGVPAVDRPRVRELIDTIFHIDADKGMVNDISLTAQLGLHEYLVGALEARRASPRDDMLTDLLDAEITDDEGVSRGLTAHEAANFGNLLISAGTETVARLLGWTDVLLGEHPDQCAALADDPGLIPNAVEELLRYEAPSPVHGRWLATEVELHGQTIPADSKALLLTGSAGRDERKYPDAHLFDVHLWRRPRARGLPGGLRGRLRAFPIEGFGFHRRAVHELACNWKTYADNYPEGYHIPLVHPRLNREIDARRYRVDVDDRWCRHSAPARDGAVDEVLDAVGVRG